MELDRYRILFYKLIRLARCVLCYTGYIYLQTRDAGVFFFFFSKGHICSYMRVWKCKTQSPWPCYSAWLNVTVFPFFFIEASHFSCKRIKYTAKCFLRNYKFFLSFLSFFFQKEERKKITNTRVHRALAILFVIKRDIASDEKNIRTYVYASQWNYRFKRG